MVNPQIRSVVNQIITSYPEVTDALIELVRLYDRNVDQNYRADLFAEVVSSLLTDRDVLHKRLLLSPAGPTPSSHTRGGVANSWHWSGTVAGSLQTERAA